jgi:hypothetical protein
MANKHQQMSQTDKYDMAIRTQTEVAKIMTERGFPMGKSRVFGLETSALRKIKAGLADVARELGYGVNPDD